MSHKYFFLVGPNSTSNVNAPSTLFIYETENNDSKRTIKLLKQEFIPAVEEEFRRVIK